MSKVAPGTTDPNYPPHPNVAFDECAAPQASSLQPPSYGASILNCQAGATVTPAMWGGAKPGSTCYYHVAPCLIVCQHCQATVTTITSYSVGTFTWLAACFLLFLGCCCGCCLLPCCMYWCKDVVHTCPNCEQMVGRYTLI